MEAIVSPVKIPDSRAKVLPKTQLLPWWLSPAPAVTAAGIDPRKFHKAQSHLTSVLDNNNVYLLSRRDALTAILDAVNHPDCSLARLADIVCGKHRASADGGRATWWRGIVPGRGHEPLINGDRWQDAAIGILRHCLATARVARFLSRHLDSRPKNPFLAGLLHDFSKLAVVSELDRVTFWGADDDCSEAGLAPLLAEFCPAFGARLARAWQVDPSIGEVMSLMRGDDSEAADLGDHPLSALVVLSDLLVRLLGIGISHRQIDIFGHPAARAMGLVESPVTFHALERIPALVADLVVD